MSLKLIYNQYTTHHRSVVYLALFSRYLIIPLLEAICEGVGMNDRFI